MDTSLYTGAVSSNYFYPSLWKPKSLREQVNLMYQCYPYLRSPDFHDITLQGGDYIFMIQNFPILAFLQQQRKIIVSLGNEVVSMAREAKSAIERLERQYESDYFFLTAQTGLRFAGASPLLAIQSITSPEFPLPLWCALHIVLTHPERFTTWDNLGFYCLGDVPINHPYPEVVNSKLTI